MYPQLLKLQPIFVNDEANKVMSLLIGHSSIEPFHSCDLSLSYTKLPFLVKLLVSLYLKKVVISF